MTNKELFKQAIADAKAVREVALANAKAALEETLQPRIQSMLNAKLQEMEDLDETKDEELDEVKDADKVEEVKNEELDESKDEEIDESLEIDLKEFLAELELDEEPIAEASDDDDKSEKEDESEEEEGATGDASITDLTVDELKDIIKDIISAELGAGEEEIPGDEMGGEEVGLDAVDDMGAGEEEVEDEIDLEELLAELDALDEAESDELDEAKKKAKDEDKDDMKEALATINTLRTELNEVNLLNAKLLYVNKIFKAKNLSETQKVKVLEAFDQATNVKEAKLVFESLSKTLSAVSSTTTKNKTNIKENLGFASKPAGVAPKKQIVEVNDQVTRMQRLAGIIK